MSTLSFDGSQPQTPVGFYTYVVAEDRWEWSDGIYIMHGFAPGEVPATTGVMLAHKHPDDRARAFEVLENACRDGRPFSCYHRVIDRRNRVRSVVSVGRGVLDAHGAVKEVVGYFIDLTEPRRSEVNAEVEAALTAIAEGRAVIEQAKGMLMLTTGCTADEAFALLRRSSTRGNVKLRDVAARLVGSVAELGAGTEARNAVLGFLDELGRAPVTTSG